MPSTPWFDWEFRFERYDTNDTGSSVEEKTYPRTPGQVDRDRILYSGHLLRLAEVTQTVSPVHGWVFHNRLSHSLKVGHVSRRMCERLINRLKKDPEGTHPDVREIVETLDPDICEAVGLAHDLGHPPFGHCAENELNQVAGKVQAACRAQAEEKAMSGKESDPDWNLEDAFEGNAQSFRIVCRLAGTHLPGVDFDKLGLDLTRQTLNGILKYPYLRSGAPRDKQDKWGAYKEESEILEFARKGLSTDADQTPRMSLEAEIMDWADDITFAVHDLLDFYSSDAIPIYFFQPNLKDVNNGHHLDERKTFIADVIKTNSKLAERAVAHCTSDPAERMKSPIERCPHTGAGDCLNRILDDILKMDHFKELKSRYTGDPAQRRRIGEITFDMIEDCLDAFKLEPDPARNDGLGKWKVSKTTSKVLQIDLLKEFTWHYIIRGQQLEFDQIGQRKAIRAVFNNCMEELKESEQTGKEPYLFPAHMRKELHAAKHCGKTRLVVDYVASMSEPELLRIYRQMIADNGYRH